MTDMPKDVNTLTALEVLELGANQFRHISVEICEIYSLTRLVLPRNLLQSVPGVIGQLVELKELDLSENQVGCLCMYVYVCVMRV